MRGRTFLLKEILRIGRWYSWVTWTSVVGCHSALETEVPSPGGCSSRNFLESRSCVPFTSHEPTSPSSLSGSSANLVYGTAPLLQVLDCQHILFLQLKSSNKAYGNNVPILKAHSSSSCVQHSSVAAIASSNISFLV